MSNVLDRLTNEELKHNTAKIDVQIQAEGIKELEEFSKNKDSLIGKIISVEFNDVTKAENNEYYALSHPAFIEIRNDKNETDDLKKVIQLRDMAKML